MKLDFYVERAVDSNVTVPVQLNEETVTASVPSFEVELNSQENHCGSYTHRFVGSANIEAAKKTFVQGSVVSLTV